jgi:excisionase family DNA binding protein
MAVRRPPIVHDRSLLAEEDGAPTLKTERARHSSRSKAGAAAAPPARARARGREVIKFYTIAEVAECLNVCPRTVRRWIDDELLIAHRPGRLVRIAEADLRLFLALHRDA